ncbi:MULTISPECIES: glycosyltransferase family 2 protein [Paenibacillus]|uniref:glycosyltransferase family 2 protein n=1 Tax=Paenibacillus TaxID=44249 RepID=UPI002FE1BFC2
MSSQPMVSIIMTVKNNGIDLFMAMESLKVSQTSIPYELILVNEGSVDGCCDFLMNYNFPRPFRLLKGQTGVPSRNLGAAHAFGAYLIFCTPRLYFEDHWMESLLAPILGGEADGVSPRMEIHETSRFVPEPCYEGELLHSMEQYPWRIDDETLAWLSPDCFAISREKFEEIGGVEENFVGKELETSELSLRIWLFGGRCQLVSATTLMLVYRQNFPSDDSGKKWGGDLLRLAELHFQEKRIAACRSLVVQAFGEGALGPLEEISRATSFSREKYAVRRMRDDSWFFDHFGIPV